MGILARTRNMTIEYDTKLNRRLFVERVQTRAAAFGIVKNARRRIQYQKQRVAHVCQRDPVAGNNYISK